MAAGVIVCTLAAMATSTAGAADDGVGEPSAKSGAPDPFTLASNPAEETASPPLIALQSAASTQGSIEVLVGVEEGRDASATVADALGVDPAQVRAVSTDVATTEVTAEELAALDAAPGVVTIEESNQLELFLSESTVRVGADVAHTDGHVGAGTRIAVIDTGIDHSHATFSGAISTAEEGCFVSWEDADDVCPGGGDSATGPGAAAPCSVEDCWHGTHVASIAAGRGGDGTAPGVAPGAQIIPIRIFSSDAEEPMLEGGSTAWEPDLIAALEHVRVLDLADPIDAVNLSLGFGQDDTGGACDAWNPTLGSKIAQLRSQGVAVVAASGNDGGSTHVAVPACVEAATAVTATLASSDEVWAGSDTGAPVELAAPGAPITAADLGGGARTAQGTSMAAPHVAGAIGVLRQSKPTSSVDWVEERLWNTGAGLTDPTNGLQLRRVDVAAALGLRAPTPLPPTDVLWLTTTAGRVYHAGYAEDWGSLAPNDLAWGEFVVASASLRSGMGYWLVTNWGRVFAFGFAEHHGDRAGQPLNQPITAMAPTATGDGYWLLAADGGIFTFGDARFHGSTGAMRLNAPVTDLARTPNGGGYWLTAKDGGVFSFGDAKFYGSTGNLTLNQPVVSVAAGPSTGYWLVALDGGVFSFAVPFHGSLPGVPVTDETGYRVRSTASGRGYYITTTEGGAYPFGMAIGYGRATGLGAWEYAVDLMLPAS